ncbi:MAG TPA: pitrilysin family protein [Nitrososphaerales archaeon]|nr:pitrilysin family protein [Nitrososphaerales archaeon]
MVLGVDLKRHRLENGLVVVFDQRNGRNEATPSIAFAGSVRAGAMFDEEGRLGTAEMVARLLNRGTQNGSTSFEVAEKIEEMCATLQFSNYDESVVYTARCHVENAGRLLQVINDCLANPSFPTEEVEKTRAEVIANLEEEKGETRTTAYRELMALIFGKDKPYGRNTLGTLEDIVKITREEVKGFHEAHYSPEVAILVATGGFDQEQLLTEIEETLGKWNGGAKIRKKDYRRMNESDVTGKDLRSAADSERSVSPARAANHSGNEVPKLLKISMEHKSQVDLALGSRAVPRTSDEFYALNLGNLMLGHIGLYGRLGKNVRDEKGLAYYCYSMVQSKLHDGSFAIYAGVNPVNVARAIEGITHEVKRMCNEPLTDEEMSTARKNLKGTLSIALESSVERANLIHDIEYFGLGLDYLDRYASILENVNSEDVLRLFNKCCSPNNISLVAVGPVGSSKMTLPKEITEN